MQNDTLIEVNWHSSSQDIVDLIHQRPSQHFKLFCHDQNRHEVHITDCEICTSTPFGDVKPGSILNTVGDHHYRIKTEDGAVIISTRQKLDEGGLLF